MLPRSQQYSREILYNAHMEIPAYVNTLLRQLNAHGYEAYVVGGAVRSSLLHEPIHDYDLTTNALPEEILQVFSDFHCIPTGMQHGTITVVIDHHPIEITTYRKDSTYEDHRHPDKVEFTSALKEDCERRDFTINALCYHPDTGILDFFNGEKDLHDKVIRCIGEPERRFEEDALRILRAIRFASRLSFRIEPHTSEVLLAKKETLNYVSIERINEEFTGMLRGKGASVCMEDYREVIEVFIPELKALNAEAYKEMCSRLEEETTARADVRLAVILYALHDNDAARRILKRLKYANIFIHTITNLLRTADEPYDSNIHFRLVLSHMKTDVDTFFAFHKANDKGISMTEKRQQYAALTNDAYCWNLKDLAINGSDLIHLGYKGTAIGEKLNALLNDVIHERIPNKKDALLKAVHHCG